MPGPDAILATLRETTRQFFALAVAWHLGIPLALIVARLARLSPSRRTATALMALPLASVSILAWILKSPFNGTVFAVLAVLAVILAARCAAEPLPRAEPWARVAGFLLVAFAWVYPHFLEELSPIVYLYASPMGLIPCPTLALVLGLTLLGAGLAGRWWIGVLAVAATFYAIFGMFRLGVTIDLFLLVGAASLVVLAARPGGRISRGRSVEMSRPQRTHRTS